MKATRFRAFGWAICALIGGLGGAARTTHGQAYTFAKVADSAGSFGYFGLPSINNAGQVSFYARDDRVGVVAVPGIYRGIAGGELTTVAKAGGTFTGIGPSVAPFATPDIDAAGRVYFQATHATLGQGIFAGTGAATAVSIEDATGPWKYFYDPTVNSSGVTAFTAGTDAGIQIVRNDGTTTSAIGGTFGPSINDLGQVAFRQPGTAHHHQIDVWTPNPAGGGTIATAFRSADPPYAYYETPLINNNGLLAFRALYGIAPGDKMAIGTGREGSFTTIADTTGPFKAFENTDGYHGLSLNSGDDVAFFATLDIPSGRGIFTGPDPVTDAVIRAGQPLFGGIVRDMRIYTSGLNDSGQVAFWYDLTNDSTGIAIATPIPEPASSLLVLGCATLWLRRR